MKIWIIILILLFPATLHADDIKKDDVLVYGIDLNKMYNQRADMVMTVPKSKYSKIEVADDWENWKVTAKVRK